ncbi:hypothetical protein C8J57DRAFT_1660506 [Mycena rebaudengoi]|nr:hypothetical protein C8J57DRAFT_1625828 [Mycena rebaudengoi]KAJ7253271.1 hypothetical protein C8J57DRAFT_1660506 [Mycena rebaudengoi]
MLGIIFLPLAAPLVIAAQLVSPDWRKPNITTPLADRIRIVGAALEQAIEYIAPVGQFYGEPYDVGGILYSQLAEFDLAAGRSKYEDFLLKYFPVAEGIRANFSDDLSYGRAAVRAYSVYHKQVFLDYAIQSWSFGRRHTLSQENISAGKTDVKPFPLAKACQGATMAGGTFYTTNSKDPTIVGRSTGNFFVLSALLAEATSDQKYLDAARESADFIHAHLYNVGKVIQDSIAADDCSTTPEVSMPYNSGLTIEGLSILASITKDASTLALLNNIITTAATQNSDWQDKAGILFNAGADLVKGLSVAYARNLTLPDIRYYIKAYIAVQFNAILDLSTTRGTNLYSGSWSGPPSTEFSGWAQTTALRVLLSAISLQNESLPLPTISGSDILPSASNSLLPPSPSGKSSVTGKIVAGTLGGLALIVTLVLSFWTFRRRQLRRASSTPPMTSEHEVISPFTEMSTVPKADSRRVEKDAPRTVERDASPDTQSDDPMPRLMPLVEELRPRPSPERPHSDAPEEPPPSYTFITT